MSLILLNKPFRVLSQFTDEAGRATLASLVEMPGVYPAGRLDYDSEGLLLLTDDGPLKSRISHRRHRLPKTYWAQVEGLVEQDALRRLQTGVTLKDGFAQALRAWSLPEPADLWPRQPPIRHRESVPDSWIAIVLDEGRNRQVRRMTAAVGLPTLRLIRVAVGPWALGRLRPGEHVIIDGATAWRQLRAYRRGAADDHGA